MGTRRPFAFTLCVIAAAVVGVAAGFYYGRKGSSGADPMIDLFTVAQSRYSSYLFSIRMDRNGEAHDDDLRSYLAYLNERARDQDSATHHLYAFDKALALTRLSQIAQSRKAISDAARLSKDADAICPSTGLRNCSANDLLFTVRERDRRTWGRAGKVDTP